MSIRDSIVNDAKNVKPEDWTRGDEEDGVDFTLDDFHGYTLIVSRADNRVKWTAAALWGTYAYPMDKELRANSASLEVAQRNALYQVAHEVADELEADERQDRRDGLERFNAWRMDGPGIAERIAQTLADNEDDRVALLGDDAPLDLPKTILRWHEEGPE